MATHIGIKFAPSRVILTGTGEPPFQAQCEPNTPPVKIMGELLIEECFGNPQMVRIILGEQSIFLSSDRLITAVLTLRKQR